MTRKITLVPRSTKVPEALTTPVFHECYRRECDSPILVGQKVLTFTTDVRVYHVHRQCPEHD